MQRISLAALLALAVALGALWGLRAIPPGETEIIVAVAADYVAETGGEATDCAARPASVEGVRLVVVCGEGWARAVDEMGRAVALDPGALAAGAGT
ncbi:hypothetical protein N8I71_17475 [Roseibacterium sp. SDUM158016]|jgi:hypothetical protein|uniref:hypothetical protein n=1 Tax=Roseicyclus sediminis TaxID=2980997 RepID=UPI0021CE122A|nr:hypothetical protein [Roseibacterium sp. SDUM158016]MCU4654634.1 hypothetical protein [Roseibacterium sp. SDUM158016]